MPLFIGFVFVFVFGTIAVGIFRGITEWQSNNQQPMQTVAPPVVTKRQHVSGGGYNAVASLPVFRTALGNGA